MWEEVLVGFEFVKNYFWKVIVEKFVEGFDYCVFVVNYKVIVVVKREFVYIIGDGKNIVCYLIDLINVDLCRGYGYENVLMEIIVDCDMEELFVKKGLILVFILVENEKVYLKFIVNLSIGGMFKDVIDFMYLDNIFICECIFWIVGLDVCGIDIMVKNLWELLVEFGGVIFEVNVVLGFRMYFVLFEGIV